ncbi:glycoside hydrolase family 15 protein [Chlorogloeopsis sp. ULAP02]|uniref:glycoside hydrolase family 15 protein n=1 Tax=Chlorogloeopsis sp. ULAP02 TaxID=3107926 RepID=UPI00313707BC
MTNDKYPDIRDLAIIGDRRTAALIDTKGTVVWYCPERFDRPSLLAALLDPERGGAWSVRSPDTTFASRRYLEDSAVLETTFATTNGNSWQITDWMCLGEKLPRGICRLFSPVPNEVTVTLQPAPDYAQHPPDLQYLGQAVQIDRRYYLYASHPLILEKDCIYFKISEGESGWAVLADEQLASITIEKIETWLEITQARWQKIASYAIYHGPYEREIANSLRALRMLTFEDNGGIIAAATTSLPEVVGGERNYDYRYVWLRDAGMIVSALIRAGSNGDEERRFLDYICGFACNSDSMPLKPFTTLDGEPVHLEKTLDWVGYRGSQPVVIGNAANSQLQLDAFGNVLLAAKLIYNRFDTREHWSLIEKIADYLVEHWSDPDHGLWEEQVKHQYTSSKVIVACGLNYIAELAENEAQAKRWRSAAQEIKQFVACECLNSEGAYAAFAGGEVVDVSAALFPVWGYTAPDTPEMLATIKVLERKLANGYLYHRHLEQFDSKKEGAFLAGTFWVAQYWVMRRDFQQARAIIDAALEYANDLGLFAEEADVKTKQMLGNFPQTFVHAAFIGAVIDLKIAQEH